jgi:hypothetical protein
VSDKEVQENDLLWDIEEVQASAQVNVEGSVPKDVAEEEIGEENSWRLPFSSKEPPLAL